MIEILFQDSHIVVCVKPVGVLSQCDGQMDMVALLKEQVGAEIFPVHRLDRNVGGVMAFARNAKAAATLSGQIQNGGFVKRYFAAVQGVPLPASGEMTDLLFKDSRSGKTFVVDRPRKAQFASRRMPLLGDGKYGSRDKQCDIALWSYKVSFTHPTSGEPMDFAAYPDMNQYPWNCFDIGLILA